MKKKNSIKRAQSQAGLSFAERKNFRPMAKILTLLVLLMTAVSGAWAQEQSETIATTNSIVEGTHFTISNNDYYADEDGMNADGGITVTSKNGETITKVVISCTYGQALVNDGNTSVSSGTKEITNDGGTITVTGVNASTFTFTCSYNYSQFGQFVVYYTEAPAGPEVTWNATTNTGTFEMPASNVVLTPQYAPVAAWAEVESVKQLPAAAEGLVAGTDAPLIAEGTGIVAFAGTSTEVTQGQVMYAVTTSAEAAPALDAFSATVPNAKDYDDAATLYVWYYIQGQDTPDGQEATEENTFNDSEICATPLTVQVLTNKFDITFNAANANTIEGENGKGTVTVKTGDAEAVDKTADIDADHKLKAVKMGSEVKMTAKQGYKFRKVEAKKKAAAAAKTITIGDMELTYADGDKWETIVSKNSDKIQIKYNMILQLAQPAPDTYKYLKAGETTVRPNEVIDPTKNYSWGEVAFD